MDAIAQTRSGEDEVRALLDSYFAAIRTVDLDRIVAHYATDLVAYDAIATLEFAGVEPYKAHWNTCIASCRSMILEPRDLVVAVGDDVAAAHCLMRCGGVTLEGTEVSGWMRGTFVMRRRDGRWLIVHEHYSSPFDPMTDKVLHLHPDA